MSKYRKIPSSPWAVALWLIASLGLANTAQAAVKLQLSGQAPSVVVSPAAHALYSGGDAQRSPRRLAGSLQSSMRKNGQSAISADIARFTIQLATKDFNTRGKGSGSLAALTNRVNPFNGGFSAGGTGKTRSGLNNLSLTLGPGANGDSSGKKEEFNMPNLGQPLVAELHYDGSNGLTFEAWYKNPTTNVWHDFASADTSGSISPPAQVPEPVSLFLMALGLLALVSRRLSGVKPPATVRV